MKPIVEYQGKNQKIALFNGIRFVRDERTGFYLSSQKIGNKRKRLHVYVWEHFNGPVPEGYHVHHIDQNRFHNDIENLQCVEEVAHITYHSRKYAAENPEKARENANHARIYACKWHGSEAGREWHKEHYAKYGAAMYVEREYTCQICGKVFKSTKVNAKYCCNAHKSTARRRSGVDNITAVCEVCGKPFVKNKYSKAATCSRKCTAVMKWKRIRSCA